MATDPDPPMYSLIDNDVYAGSYEMTDETFHLGQGLRPTPTSPDKQPGDVSAGGQQRLFFHGWAPELLSLFFSAACLTTISILLVVYHEHPVTSFPEGITLNAVVAVLTAAFKSSLLYTVSSAIGQSKWNLFWVQDRRLRDVERIDEAGKSLRGALSALINIPWSITSLGAIIIILGFLIDPFAQQLIKIVPAQVIIESDTVWTGVFTNFNMTQNADSNYDHSFSIYLNSAFWGNASLYDRQAHCPTGNCTFLAVVSLQWCAKTEAIDLNRVTSNCTIDNEADIYSEIYQYQTTTGNGMTKYRTCAFFLDGGERPLTTISQSFTVGAPSDLPETRNESVLIINAPIQALSADHGWAIVGDRICGVWLGIICPPAVFSYLRFDFGNVRNATPRYLDQSVLTLCNTESEVIVTSGHTTTIPISSQFGQFILNDTDSVTLGKVTLPNGFCFTSGENNQKDTSGAIENSHKREPQHLAPTLSFCWKEDDGPNAYDGYSQYWWGAWFDALSLFMEHKTLSVSFEVPYGTRKKRQFIAPGTYLPDFSYPISDKGLNGVMESLAAAMNSAWNAKSRERVTGSYFQYETIFQVQWGWILLPILLNLLAFVLQIIVIRQSRVLGQQQLWRGSVLAALYHGVDDTTIQSEMTTISEMREDADTNIARLRFSNGGRAMLVPQNLETSTE